MACALKMRNQRTSGFASSGWAWHRECIPMQGQLAVTMHAAWLIDLDGTLYDPRPVKVMMGLSLLLSGRSAISGISAFRRAHEEVRVDIESMVGDEQKQVSAFDRQLERAAQNCGWSTDRLRATVQEWMIQRPGPWLRRFRRRKLLREIEAFRTLGGKCAIVSDYPASEKLDAMGIRSLFDVVVSNGEPGGPTALKPDPAGYLSAAKRLQVAPEQCLVIGDRPDADGLAAERAGMAFRQI